MYIQTAQAGITVGNQPVFDEGGMAIKTVQVVKGEAYDWETLFDTVTLKIDPNHKNKQIKIQNIIREDCNLTLPENPDDHTAGVLLQKAKELLRERQIDFDFDIECIVEKGISIQGTGLGSSAATPAATLKAFEKILADLRIEVEFSVEEKLKILYEADFRIPDNVIPAYFGGMIHVLSKDDPFKIEKISKHRDFGYFVITTPRGLWIETALARKALEGLSPGANKEELKRAMLAMIQNNGANRYGELMEKAHAWFVQPRSRLYPQEGKLYNSVYQSAKKAGAGGVTISGAGPTMIAAVQDPETGVKVGEAMYEAFAQAGYEAVARLVDIDEEGAMGV